MAIDQQSPSTPADEAAVRSAIENEFPTYRAISGMAVSSMVLGVVSVFCYADLWFLLVSGLAVLLGFLAIRKIHRLPDILTGAAYARVGIGIALLFGLSALTRTVVQDIQANMDASQFAKHYVEVIQNEPIASAIWYQQPPEYRKTKSPDEIVDEIKKSSPKGAPDLFAEKSASIQAIKDRIKSPGQHMHFSKIESKDINGLTTYANALIEVDGPATTEFPEKEQFALFQLIKGSAPGKLDWTVSEVKFPYTPASAVALAPKKIDDGHGH